MNQVRPTLRQWFWTNLEIGALSFGGSGRMLLYQDAVVQKNKWLSEDEFLEILTVSTVFPGPNLVNLAVYLGRRLLGIWGALAALLALVTPGAFFVILLVSVVPIRNENVIWLSQGFSIASVVLSTIFVWRLILGLRVAVNPFSHIHTSKLILRGLLALGIGICSILGVPLVWLLIVGGAFCCFVEFKL